MIDDAAAFAPAALIVVGLAIWAAATGRRLSWTVVATLCVLYVAAVLSLTLLPLPVDPELIRDRRELGGFPNNWVPFRSIRGTIEYHDTIISIRQIGGNIVMFVPLGVLAPLASPRFRRWSRMMLLAVAAAVLVEASQLAISALIGFGYKSADIDDVLLNTLGAMFGFAAYRVVTHLRSPRQAEASAALSG